MRILIDKFTLLTGCFLFQLYYYPDSDIPHVIALLSAITLVCLFTYCNPDMVSLHTLKPSMLSIQIIFSLLFLLAGLCIPTFTPFLPLLFYELADNRLWQLLPAFFIVFIASRAQSAAYFVLFLLLFLLTFYLKHKTLQLLQLEQNFRRLRDTSTEHSLLLQQKNQELIRQQDYEIYTATLKERNRIAREIHDNVGHMLSRSILQSGALLAINKDPDLNEPLISLKDTLSLAMTSVRESVHDLHDDSIDLKSSLNAMIRNFADYDIQLAYDMDNVIPKNIKYCFIAIAKEALSNIAKHSNATRIRISVQEHPAFYQFIITDNGTNISVQHTGIGLINMQERVEQLHGHFSLTTEQGFHIFISIPKQTSKTTQEVSDNL